MDNKADMLASNRFVPPWSPLSLQSPGAPPVTSKMNRQVFVDKRRGILVVNYKQ